MTTRTSKYLVLPLRATWLALVALARFMASIIGLLAESAKTSDTDDATNQAARGGVLNYRTGKPDDGTDAAGWYEKD